MLSSARPSNTPALADRIIVAVCIALLSVAFTWINVGASPPPRTDLDQIWFAAHALWQGRDPYPLIGPGKEFTLYWPFYYPLPAAVIAAPLGLLPIVVARLVFVALSGGLLAFIVLRDGWYRILLFLSCAYTVHLLMLQWSVLLTCALLVPSLGFLMAVKPNVGISTFVGQRSWRGALLGAGGAAVATLLSFALQPGWFGEWLNALKHSDHFAPTVLLPGGFLTLLAVFRWRRWEGRLLLALACVPQTQSVVSFLPLLLIPKSWKGTALLSALSYAPLFLAPYFVRPGMSFADVTRQAGMLALFTIYLPALAMVLRLPANPDESQSHADGRGSSLGEVSTVND